MLFGNEAGDGIDFRGVHKGALDAHHFTVYGNQHVAAPDELVCPGRVEDGAGVNHGCHLEGDAGREVRFDESRDDVGRGTLGGNNHVDTHGTCQLGDTRNRGFHFFACRHDEVGKLVHDHHNVGEVAVPFVGIEQPFCEFFVVFFDVTHLRVTEQVVAGVHFDTEGVQCIDYLCCVRDDGFPFVREFCQKMPFDDGIDA